MDLKKRIETFARLGEIMMDASLGIKDELNGELTGLIERSHQRNGWFTPENVKKSLNSIGQTLTVENLNKWIKDYPGIKNVLPVKNIGVIMAGNIPLVGFHDFLSVLITGNRILAKRSSKDMELIKSVADILIAIEPAFRDYIEFIDDRLSGFDAIIATGSDNSSRYFEYYFGKYSSVIRKNRNSIAILDGEENQDELKLLGEDIFNYFGLGCRSISKIYVPTGYNIMEAVKEWDHFSSTIYHSKYANNYDYNKAIYIVNKDEFIDTGYMLIKKDKALSSPVSVLFYEEYSSLQSLQDDIFSLHEKLQCITGHGYLPFGSTQIPALWDYADGVDTIEFLLKITNHHV